MSPTCRGRVVTGLVKCPLTSYLHRWCFFTTKHFWNEADKILLTQTFQTLATDSVAKFPNYSEFKILRKVFIA